MEVISPSGAPAPTPLRISTPPAAYRRSETLILSLMLEHVSSQVSVEAVVEDIGVPGEGLPKDHLSAGLPGRS